MSIKNKKVAIITGVTSFLGRSTAKYLLEKGFIVFGIVRLDLDINKLSNLKSNNDKSLSESNFHIIKLDFNSLTSNDFINISDNSIDNQQSIQLINNIKDLYLLVHKQRSQSQLMVWQKKSFQIWRFPI